MGLRDIIFAPITLTTVILITIYIRNQIKDEVLKKYFLLAFLLKIFGGVSLGLIYQFYYSGGDTYNYFNQGSIIYQAICDSPIQGLKLLFGVDKLNPELYEYSSKIYWLEAKEYFIIQVSAFFSLVTFNNYTSVAILFGALNFIASVLMYKTFRYEFPHLRKKLIFSIFFIPSVFLWASGITKDSLAMTGLGLLIYSLHSIFIRGNVKLTSVLLMAFAVLFLQNTKIYIMIAMLIAFAIAILFKYSSLIKNTFVKLFALPILIGVLIISTYTSLTYLVDKNSRYSFDNLSKFAYIASLYHTNISNTEGAGERGHGRSGYQLEVFDGSFISLMRLAPNAIILSFFRPFLWEIRNPLMILSALEGVFFVLITINAIRFRRKNPENLRKSFIVFCLVFSITIALAAGLTSGNFGNLSRYRIPALPFYCIAMFALSSKGRLTPNRNS